MPTAVCPAATGLLTTADAATTAPSLISMFPSTLEPAHMSTSFPTFGCRSWSGDVPVAPSVTSCMIETLSPITAVSPMTTCVPSSRRRVDGVEVDATVQHEGAVEF